MANSSKKKKRITTWRVKSRIPVLHTGSGAGTGIYHFTVCNVCCVFIYQ